MPSLLPLNAATPVCREVLLLECEAPEGGVTQEDYYSNALNSSFFSAKFVFVVELKQFVMKGTELRLLQPDTFFFFVCRHLHQPALITQTHKTLLPPPSASN